MRCATKPSGEFPEGWTLEETKKGRSKLLCPNGHEAKIVACLGGLITTEIFCDECKIAFERENGEWVEIEWQTVINRGLLSC